MTVIVLDNDETTGQYSHLMTYMGYVARCLLLTPEQETGIIDTIATIAKANGIFRPGTEAFLRSLSERKRAGVVTSVVMYTNALADPAMSWHSKSLGVVDWPHFLARVLSSLAGDPTLFDIVLSRPPHLTHVAYPKKHFARVTDALAVAGRPLGDKERIIFFDDKPTEILGVCERFVAWRAPEYKVPVTLEQINRALELLRLDESETLWADFTPAMIRKEIYTMTARCRDAFIPPPVVSSDGLWCGFDFDTHLPLPPPPPAAEPAPAFPPAHPTLVIETESESESTGSDSETPLPRTGSRRIRLHIEITLNISVGRRYKKKWGSTWGSSSRCSYHHIPPSHHMHYSKQKH